MQGNHENQNLFFELTTFFFPAKKNLVGNLQIYGILLLTRKRNFKNVDNTFGTNHSTRKTQSKNFLIFYVLHKIGIFKDAAEQLLLFFNIPVINPYTIISGFSESMIQHFGNCHRTVFATGTSDADHKLVLSFIYIVRDQKSEKVI